MGRTTVYNRITSDLKLSQINPDNKELVTDFLDYLHSIDKSPGTIKQYKSDLNIFFVWNLDYNKNKFFVELTKREISKFQSHAINEWGWSPKRIRRVKSTLSSLSNFIENILDDEYKDYKPIIRKIENPVDDFVREKSIFEEDDLQKLLDYLVEHQEYMKACLLSLAISSGRRKAELCRFKVSYFDKENIIYGSLYKTPEKIVTKGRGSRGKLLTCYTFVNKFQPYFDYWMKQREELGITSEWLFPKKRGNTYTDEQIEPQTLDSFADTFSRILGIPFYWHSMRHFFVTYCAKSNLPDSVIQQIQGWKSADMIGVYKDLTTDEELGKYFDENGIKQVEAKKLSDF